MKRFVLGSLVLISVVACSDSANPDVAFQFRETPLRQLQGVEIGMPAKDLRRARPAARYAPFLGMQETVPGYIVSYGFNQVMNDKPGAEVPATDRLLSVFVTQRFDSEQAATAGWREEIGAVRRAHGAPTFCERLPNGGRQAGWAPANKALVVGVFPPEANAPNVGWRVITAISSFGAMKKPAGAIPATCPN